jgi:hypothetical protein
MEQLFTRTGEQFSGNVAADDKGRPVRYVPVSCDRCAVINGVRVWCRGTVNGQPFSNTGFDCWTCSNSGVRGDRKERLYTATELARVNKAAATREAKRAVKVAAAVAQAAAERQAREESLYAAHAEFVAKLNGLDGEFWDGFRVSFFQRLEAPTARQIALVDAEIAKRQQNAASGYIGAVGDKVTLTITVERVVVLESQLYGTNYITIARDEHGNVVTYRGRTDIGNKGDTSTIKASIKEHTVYNGVKQTVIQRPKAA